MVTVFPLGPLVIKLVSILYFLPVFVKHFLKIDFSVMSQLDPVKHKEFSALKSVCSILWFVLGSAILPKNTPAYPWDDWLHFFLDLLPTNTRKKNSPKSQI